MVIQICVGSSCHLKGSEELAALMQQAIEENKLEDEVVLTGSLCIGKCSPRGITVQVDDTIHLGVTTADFKEFFATNVIQRLERERT